jgi:hypothetical protein
MQKFFSLLSWRLFAALHVFRRFSAHHQELNYCSDSLWFYLRIVVTVVLCSCSGRLTGPTTNTARLSPRYEGKTRGCHCSHWAPMMGGKTPKTCWVLNKLQDNKLENCCISLVIYFNCTMMHGLIKHKKNIFFLLPGHCQGGPLSKGSIFNIKNLIEWTSVPVLCSSYFFLMAVLNFNGMETEL